MSSADCYLLFLEASREIPVRVAGRLINIPPCTLVYIGSGAGGRALSRALRHLARPLTIRWHIDLLTALDYVSPLGAILINAGDRHCEERISEILLGKLPFVPGFGCTDKRRDISHLFYCCNEWLTCASMIYEDLESRGFEVIWLGGGPNGDER